VLRWNGVGRVLGRGRGRSVDINQSPTLACFSRRSSSAGRGFERRAGLSVCCVELCREYTRTERQLTWMLLLLLRLLLGEEEVRLGGSIAFPKGGHGYLSLSRRSLAGSRRETLVVCRLALACLKTRLSRSAVSHTITAAHAGASEAARQRDWTERREKRYVGMYVCT
jgi:hypothetical protein